MVKLTDITCHDEIDDLIDALRPLAAKAKVENAYWIVTPDGEYISNNGNEWCHDCGTAKVRNLRNHDRKRADEYILDGGWVTEHDTPPMCAHCGVKLEASLLFYGGTYELDHFRDYPPVPGNADQAYEISEMLSALQYTKPEETHLALEAINIARKLIKQNSRAALSEQKEEQ